MTKITFSQLIAGALFSLCLATVPARALSLQTYVSGKGTDTGACATPATACRTFAFAIVQTANSGEIKAIDPANYGPVTITKAISIVGHDGAGIALASGTAIAVTAGASDSVNLRGLTLDGAGTPSQGIFLSSAGSATITNCFVRHFKDLGIQLQSGAALNFIISNTIVSDQVSATGLAIAGTTGVIKGVVDHFAASDNGTGITVAVNGKLVEVSIVNSVMAANREDGLLDQGAKVTVRNSVASQNGGNGFEVSAGGTLTLADSMATNNSSGGVSFNGAGTLFSYGDNEINGNGIDISGGTLTILRKR